MKHVTIQTDAADSTFEASIFPQARADAMRDLARDLARAIAAGRLDAIETPFDGQPWVRRDAPHSLFLAGQLEHIRAGLIEMRYPDLKLRTIVPTAGSIPAGAQQYTFQEVDEVADAQVGADKADDFNLVDVYATETTSFIKPIRNGYGYSDEELLAAQMTGMPLPTRKAQAARKIIERRLDAIGWLGSSSYVGAPPNLKGLANLANTTSYTVTAGVAGSTAIETMSSKEILERLNGMVAKVVEDTLDIHHPTDIVLPLSFQVPLTTRTMGDGNAATILETFLKNQPFVRSVTFSHKLEPNASAPWTTNRRAIALEKSPEVLELIEPMGFTQKSVQERGFNYIVPCWAKTGGVVAYKPKAVCYADWGPRP